MPNFFSGIYNTVEVGAKRTNKIFWFNQNFVKKLIYMKKVENSKFVALF